MALIRNQVEQWSSRAVDRRLTQDWVRGVFRYVESSSSSTAQLFEYRLLYQA
jgi:hypothetical protein